MLRCMAAACITVAACASCSEASRDRESIRVFCAASVADAVEQISLAYEAQHPGINIEINAAASSTLARQIEAGAPCDIFIAANPAWIGHLEDTGLIRSESRVDLVGNRLALIAHVDDADAGARLLLDQAAHSSDARLALGDPAHVPAGQYAKQAMQSLGVWEAWADHVVPAADVRAALQFVATRQVRLGVVYATDAIGSSEDVRVLEIIDERLHDPIVYPAALTPGANGAAAKLLSYIRGEQASEVFREAGFVVLRSPR